MGAHFTPLPPLSMWRVSSKVSSCAESSFLPPCRAISTVKVRPLRFSTLSSTARPTSTWYGRNLRITATYYPRLNPSRVSE